MTTVYFSKGCAKESHLYSWIQPPQLYNRANRWRLRVPLVRLLVPPGSRHAHVAGGGTPPMVLQFRPETPKRINGVWNKF